MSNAVKVTLNMPAENVEFVEQLSQKTGLNKTNVVNHAIQLEKYVREALARGARILVEESDGSLKEVLIR